MVVVFGSGVKAFVVRFPMLGTAKELGNKGKILLDDVRADLLSRW